jgi:hypothetical protein
MERLRIRNLWYMTSQWHCSRGGNRHC